MCLLLPCKTALSPRGVRGAHSPRRCRPRKRPSDRPCPGDGGDGGDGGGDGRRARGCARSLGAQPLRPAPARAPGAAGAPTPPRVGPAHDQPATSHWPVCGVGRGRQVRVLLFCSCGGLLAQRPGNPLPEPFRPLSPAGAVGPPQHRRPPPRVWKQGPGLPKTAGSPPRTPGLGVLEVGERKGNLLFSIFFLGHLSAR